MVFFYLAPVDKGFTVLPGNAMTINSQTGGMTSRYDPRYDDMMGRPRQREDPVAIARMVNMLNAAAARRGSRPQTSEHCEESSGNSGDSDIDDEDSECSSDDSEIECNEIDRIVIRKGEKVKTYKKFKESGPRRHPLFEDVKSEPENKDMPSILSLDDRCINLILSHVGTLNLFKLSTLCKSFYNLCSKKLLSLEKLSTRQLFREFPDDESSGLILNQSNIVTLLSATGGNLKELVLETGVGYESYDTGIYFTKEISTAVSRHCRNLESLNIEFNKLGGIVGLQSFAKHLPAKNKLKSLALKARDRKRDGKVLTEGLLGDILRKTKNLERLHVESSDLIDGSCIIKHLKDNKITSLSFCNCKNLDVKLLDFIVENHHSTIEHLYVYAMDMATPWECSYDFITNSPSLNFNVKSPKLNKIQKFFAMRYDDCMPIDFEGNVNLSLLQLMPNLKELDLSFNCDLDVSPFLLRSVAAMCPLIEILKLCGANIKYVKALRPLENLYFLKEMSLLNACCNYETSEWSIFDHGTFGREIVPLLKALKRLSMNGIKIRDSGIFTIIKNSPTLAFLEADLDNCDGSFIDKCCKIDRSTMITVSSYITEKEMKSPSFRKLRDAIGRCPKFMKINTDYSTFPELKAWYNGY